MYRVLNPISRDGRTIPAGEIVDLAWLDDRGVTLLVNRGDVEVADADSDDVREAIARREVEARQVGEDVEVPSTVTTPNGEEVTPNPIDPEAQWRETDTVTVLRDYAKRYNVDLLAGDNKSEILEKLRAARGDFEVTDEAERKPDGTWVTDNPNTMSTKAE